MADPDDRGTILRLCDDTLPALIGRLDASSLGELEVRKGTWRVRLRRKASNGNGAPAHGAAGARSVKWGRRATDVTPPPKRDAGQQGQPAQAGQAGQPGQPGQAAEGRPRVDAAALVSGNGSGPQLTPVGPGRERVARPELSRRTATAPAVGYYVPLDEVSPGHRIRSGDVIGHVDVLGVRVEVVSPSDGVVGRVLAQPGEAVEYGQELLRIDLAGRSEGPSEGEPLEPLAPTEG